MQLTDRIPPVVKQLQYIGFYLEGLLYVEERRRKCLSHVRTGDCMEHDGEAWFNELRGSYQGIDVLLGAADLQFVVVELLIREAEDRRV